MRFDSRTRSNIDYLRGFAAFLVVFGHALSYYGAAYAALPRYAAILEDMIYQVHVPLFFVISGFLCHRQPVHPFYRKKALRILVPFWFFAALKLVYTSWISGRFAHASSLSGQLYDAFVIGQTYWFAYAIFLMFLLAPLFWEKEEITAPKKAMAAFAVFTAFNIITSVGSISVLPRVFQIGNTVKYLPFFLAGMILRFYCPRAKKLFARHRAWIVCLALAAAAASAAVYAFGVKVDPYVRKLITAFALILPLLALANALPENNRFLTLAGGLSYQIMLLDPFFKVVFFAVLGKLFGVSLAAAAAVAVLNFALSILTCVIARKIPVIKTLFGL